VGSLPLLPPSLIPGLWGRVASPAGYTLSAEASLCDVAWRQEAALPRIHLLPWP